MDTFLLVSGIYSIGKIVTLIGLVVLLGFGYERILSTYNGFKSGLIAGFTSLTLLTGVALAWPGISWFTPVYMIANMLLRDNVNFARFRLDYFLVGVLLFILVASLFGVLFTYLQRSDLLIQIFITGLIFGVAVWGLFSLTSMKLLLQISLESGFRIFWFEVIGAIYGVTVGLISFYLPE